MNSSKSSRAWLRPLGASALGLLSAGCVGLGYVAINTPALFGEYELSKNHAYGDDPRQQLDVYSPVKASNRPVVIFWYGGTWTNGRRSLYRFVGAALAERGFVVVIPDYRLYPKVKFPAFIDDGRQAILWTQQHAREYGGDPTRIVLMGHSAGAHEAALLAYDREALRKAGVKPESIVGLVGLSGPYALAPDSAKLHAIFAAPYTARDWQPVQFVTPQSPPTFLAHGMADDVVYVSHSEQLRDALKANGVRVETAFYPDKRHADTVSAFSVPLRKRLPLLEETVRFIGSVTPEPAPAR